MMFSHNSLILGKQWGFPDGSVVKEFACNVEDLSSIPEFNP